MGDSDYPTPRWKYTPLKYGFAYQLPESEDFLFAKATVEKIVDLRRRALKHMERMLQEEVFMNFFDDHTLSDWPDDFGHPHSNLTIISARDARGILFPDRDPGRLDPVTTLAINSRIRHRSERGERNFNVSVSRELSLSLVSALEDAGYEVSRCEDRATDTTLLTVTW